MSFDISALAADRVNLKDRRDILDSGLLVGSESVIVLNVSTAAAAGATGGGNGDGGGGNGGGTIVETGTTGLLSSTLSLTLLSAMISTGVSFFAFVASVAPSGSDFDGTSSFRLLDLVLRAARVMGPSECKSPSSSSALKCPLTTSSMVSSMVVLLACDMSRADFLVLI